ncbi:gluconokinase [Lysinibacter sp. HNR]|uniref:gluconokinase n=1 Tax=Lysinibacter sp. HNR TaxID=3031408 RepID=UPI002434FD08|nr:gluconokinase [Lysinibacter sp. HNR]WGD38177.1 gluconokinase [Lysinibacter sp. HNR]
MSRSIVVMGVSGSGKSVVGFQLARRLRAEFVDADDLHPLANKEKMAAGIPLADADRWPWLDQVAKVLADADEKPVVVACSALRRVYRDRLRAGAPDIIFVHLDGTRELIVQRLEGRHHEFMNPSLIDSQIATLEPLEEDEAGGIVSIGQTVMDVAADAFLVVAASDPSVRG